MANTHAIADLLINAGEPDKDSSTAFDDVAIGVF